MKQKTKGNVLQPHCTYFFHW